MRGDDTDEGGAIRALLLRVFLPLWFVPGLIDYYHHRKTRIETTSGTRESLLHGMMFASVGVPVTLALLVEIDGFILSAAAVAALAHEALTLYDVRYAYDRRVTAPAEQHVHSFLEVMPIVGACMLAAAHPRVLAELRADYKKALVPRLRPKRHPVSLAYLTGFFSAVAAFIVLPYSEEFVRCFLHNPTLSETPLPDDPSALS